MGYMRHHAIIVCTWDDKQLKAAHVQAVDIFGDGAVTEITPPAMNSYSSFMVAPDGSKEWWPTSDEGNANRDAFVTWLDATRYDDGSSALGWVEVQFDDDNYVAEVIRHNEEEERRKPGPELREPDPTLGRRYAFALLALRLHDRGSHELAEQIAMLALRWPDGARELATTLAAEASP